MTRLGHIFIIILLGLRTFSQSDSTKIFGWVVADARLERKFVTNAKVILYEGKFVHEAISDSKGYYFFNFDKHLDTAIISVQIDKTSTTGSNNDRLFIPANTKTKLVFGQTKTLKHIVELKIVPNCKWMPEITFELNSLKLVYDTANANRSEPNYFDNSPYIAIAALVSIMSDNPTAIMEISGHCDWRENNSLACKRANFIISELVRNGVNPKRLVSKGYGSSQPLVSKQAIKEATTKEEKEFLYRKNRRVTSKILGFYYKDN